MKKEEEPNPRMFGRDVRGDVELQVDQGNHEVPARRKSLRTSLQGGVAAAVLAQCGLLGATTGG